MTAPDPSLYTIECLTDRCNDCQGHRPRRGISADPVCFCPCHVEAEVRATAGALARYYAEPFEGRPGDSTYAILRHVAACIETGETVESIDPEYARIARGGAQ